MGQAPGGFADSLAMGSLEPVLSVTASGRVLVWTRRAELAFGYSRAEAIGRPLLALVVPPDGVDDYQSALARAMAEGAARCQALRRRKDGTLLRAVPMRAERRGVGADASLVFLAGREAADAVMPEAEVAAVEAAPTLVMHGRADEADAREGLASEVRVALETSFSPVVMAQRAAAILVPQFADWCAVDLLDGIGPARRAASVHESHDVANALGALAPDETHPLPFSAQRVLRSAQPQVSLEPPVGPSAGPAAAPAELRGGAFLVLPLQARTRLVGALTLVRAAPRPFSQREASWAASLARAMAIEIENALLLDQVQRLRDTASHATERARLLHNLSSALSEALTPVQVTEEAVRQAQQALGASGGAVAMLSDDHATFEVTALIGEAEPLSNALLRFPVHATLPLADAARSGDAVILEHLLGGAPRYPYLAHGRRAEGALAVVPLIVEGRNVGSLGLVFPGRRAFGTDELEFMRNLARHAADALERARLYGAERSARAVADAEARRSAFLADASRILSSSFDYRATLEAAARLAVPNFADWCAVYLREKDGTIRTVTAVHSDPARSALARELLWRPGPDPDEPGGVGKVLRMGKPEIFTDVPDHMLESLVKDADTRRIVRQLGLRTQAILPLVARGRTLGAIALCSATHRRLVATDLQLLEELARRAALAVDNARLYHEVEEAYRRKEESMAALRESEERYRLLVDGAKDYALFLLDAEGRIQSWNPGAERLLGYKAEEVIGRTPHFLYSAEDLASHRPEDELEEANVTGRSETEGWRIRKDGTRYWANVVVTVLRDEKGRITGYSKLHRDVSEAKRAREELENARQRVTQHEKLSTMGTLVSGVAHEIRTPLTAIANSLHLIRLQLDRNTVTPDSLRRHTSLALEGVERINALVQDLRRFKRVEGTGHVRTSLDGVVLEALNLFRAAHRGRIEVADRLEPTPLCEVDRAQLQQVVLNLLQNASEAMPHGGVVELRTGANAQGQAIIVVRDSGIGMPPEVKARMFEEFFTTKAEGTGLGLSIVRRIMELHNGRIECESVLGQGTTFTLALPPVPGR